MVPPQSDCVTRSMNDEDGPFIAKIVYKELLQGDTAIIAIDKVPYALDLAVRKLRESGAPPYRWAPYIHMGA